MKPPAMDASARADRCRWALPPLHQRRYQHHVERALGTVTPLATVTVRPQVSGNIQSINFQEGQMVKAGDVLAVIDPRPYIATLDQARGTLAKDVATLRKTRRPI